ncbi:hypothetical protein [Pseudomonas phage PA1C]|nr:hypothetical protein [Pseudomonas phage PA1C]
MAFACCNAVYMNYINRDGSFNIDVLRKIFGVVDDIIQKERTDELAVWHAKKHDVPVAKATFVIIGGIEQELCTCDCHKHDGLNVLH